MTNAAWHFPPTARRRSRCSIAPSSTILKFHADTMVLLDDALAADPSFVMGHVFKAYLLLTAANPANTPAIAATLAAAQAGAANVTQRETMHVAACAAWADGALDRVVPHLAADSRRDADRPARRAHLRHHLVPPRPDRSRSWNRPTASRRAGRRICLATTASTRSGPSRMKKPATTTPPSAKWMPRSSTTRRTTSRTTSRRT